MKRPTAEPEPQAAAAPPAPAPAPVVPTTPSSTSPSAPAQRPLGPHSREEAEELYIAARDSWVQAMHAASNGRPSDLASLALAQEAYEAATAEREGWITRVRPSGLAKEAPRGIEAAVGQEMAWRRVKHHEKREGFLARLKRRITGSSDR